MTFEAYKQYQEEAQVFLKSTQTQNCQVVVMPDFFLDRIVDLQWHLLEGVEVIKKVVERKGGSIDGVHQIDKRGGNAINTAASLLSLGASVTPIICTSKYGLELLKYHFKNTTMDLSHVKTVGNASITTALEFMEGEKKINVMLRDVGALADFGPDALDKADQALIEKTDYVCVFNWAGTKNHGTTLAQTVFEQAKHGRGKTYCDTADPTPNTAGMAKFLETVLKTNRLDILSLNENEAITYAGIVDPEFRAKKMHLCFADCALEAARVLAQCFSARIDLHTSAFSASLRGTNEVVVPTFKISSVCATGAGDAWNAGNILADFGGLSDGGRLLLANAVATCYLSCIKGAHPTKAKVAAFLRAFG
ncbi:MAG: carbohydrate kinase family protein [Nitrososphaerota archaeon]|jgi:sugar/nucleoside kinase (ribokinase family)|nr:carbohydrate kinase family protein [Nitrososphaerota archaeon]